MQKCLTLAILLAVSPAAAVAADAVAAAAPVARTATDELEAINAVSRAWDHYVETSSVGDARAIDYLAASSLRDALFVRDVAVYGSPAQVGRIPMSKRLEVYAFRIRFDAAQLLAMDARDVARECLAMDICGVRAPEDGEPPLGLAHVTLLDADRAIGELAPPTGEQYMFGPEFAREDGVWKVRLETTVAGDSAMMMQAFQRSGLPEADLLGMAMGNLFDGEVEIPPMALLDQPLLDDPAARSRLTEAWPDYQETFRSRTQAVAQKAARGEEMALLVYGSLLYSGSMPDYVGKDVERGIAMLEQASEAGNAKAATIVAGYLVEDSVPEGMATPAENLVRAVPHLRRSASGGTAAAMWMLGSLSFNGAGGLERDCRVAEEWFARAEEAGREGMRNSRVWALATCPIEGQRDPARALALAAFMVDRADSLDAAELDTVAAAYAANAHFDEAVDFQSRAIAKLGNDNRQTLKGMRERLRAYGRHQDWVQQANAYEASSQ